MILLILKGLLSGAIVVTVSELAPKNNTVASIIHSLPLVSLLAFIWLYSDKKDAALVGQHAFGTFWFVLPTLPMFLVLPAMLRNGFAFWTALAASCALTVALYLIAVWLLPRLGINV